MNWSICTSVPAAWIEAAGKEQTTAKVTTASAVVTQALFANRRPISALQRLVDNREALVATLKGDVRNAEYRAQLVVGHFHRSW